MKVLFIVLNVYIFIGCQQNPPPIKVPDTIHFEMGQNSMRWREGIEIFRQDSGVRMVIVGAKKGIVAYKNDTSKDEIFIYDTLGTIRELIRTINFMQRHKDTVYIKSRKVIHTDNQTVNIDGDSYGEIIQRN